MLFGLVRRLFGLGCFLLVAYAAVSVPIGRRTTLGHLVAIFTTQAAREAANDLESIALRAMKDRPRKPAEDPGPHTSDDVKPPNAPNQ